MFHVGLYCIKLQFHLEKLAPAAMVVRENNGFFQTWEEVGGVRATTEGRAAGRWEGSDHHKHGCGV